MRKIIRLISSTVIVGVVVLTLIIFMFDGFTYNGKKGIYSTLGLIDTTENNDSHNHEAVELLSGGTDISIGEVPEVRYVERAFETGETIYYKSMFQVKPSTSTEFIAGELESDFRIVLQNITDQYGNTLITDAETSDDELSDEVSTVLTYDDTTGEVYFYRSGIYRFIIKIYDVTGGYTIKTVQIPVEVKG